MSETTDLWREGWQAVAVISGSDRLMLERVEQFLACNQIHNAVEGSKAYGVYVLDRDAAKAIELLHVKAKYYDWTIDVVESLDSEAVIKYVSENSAGLTTKTQE